MKILVTGATGFIGNILVERILDKGHTVTVASRSKKNISKYGWQSLVNIKEYDIENSDNKDVNLFEYFGKPEKLIHLAWSNLDDFTKEDHVKKVFPAHLNFIKKLISGGLKDLTVTGTCLEYGLKEGRLSEEDSPSPSTSYAKAKDMLRKEITKLQGSQDFLLRWIRLFYIIPETPKQGTIFWELEKYASNNEASFPMSPGGQARDYLPVRILADNIAKISLQDEVTGIINCSSGIPVSLKSVVEDYIKHKILSIKLDLGARKYRDYEPISFYGDNAKLSTILVKNKEEARIIPNHLQIETINKICNAKCTMCIIWDNTRKTSIMNMDTFRKIIENFLPYKDNFKYVTLHGCGEPLLDPTIAEKVKYLKDKGFIGVGFSSNCQALNETRAKKLLEAGIDTFIVSIDGIKKETHESIRIGTNYETVVSNVQNFIRLRNEMNAKSRVLIRFIKQKKNESEWGGYKKFWEQYIDPGKKDVIVKFDVHNCGGRIPDYDKFKIENKNVELSCIDLYERIIVFTSGAYGFCSADQSAYFDLGNALNDDPVDVFNNYYFNYYRRQMKKGNISSLMHCKNCTIPLSRFYKDKGVPLA